MDLPAEPVLIDVSAGIWVGYPGGINSFGGCEKKLNEKLIVQMLKKKSY